MEYPKVRHPYHRESSPADLSGQKLQTDQSQGNETDVNKIVARFARTGELPPNNGEGQYADVTRLQGDLTILIEEGKTAVEAYKTAKNKQIQTKAEQATKDQKELTELRKEKMQNEALTPEITPEIPTTQP